MRKELYMKVLGAVDVYLYSLPRSGIKKLSAKDDLKASTLFKLYLQLAVAVLDEEDLADTIINYFLTSIVNTELLRRINKLNGSEVSNAEMQREARDMNRASKKFKSSVSSVYISSGRSSPSYQVIDFHEGHYAEESLTLETNDFPAEALFYSALPTNIYIETQRLEKVKEIRESAHTVVIYKNPVSAQLYFGKKITSQAQLQEYATEVTYAAIWRYFLGDRVSASYIMKGPSGRVEGICSEGLRGFVEYAKMPEAEDRSSGIPGLVSIIVFAYIFMEDDLHVKNLGMTLVKNETVFGKIDHDYICSRWEENESMNHLESKFPITEIQRVVRSKQLYTVKDILGAFRFSPGTKNNPLLRLAHHLRPRDATTVGPQGAKNFGLYQLPNAQEEFLATCSLIRSCDYDDFEYRIKRIITTLAKENFPAARPMSLLASINRRLRGLA